MWPWFQKAVITKSKAETQQNAPDLRGRFFFVKRQLFPQYSSSWTPKASLFCAASGGQSKNLQDQLPPEVLWNLNCFSSFDKPPVEGAGPFQVLTCTNRYQKRQHNSGLCYYAEKKITSPLHDTRSLSPSATCGTLWIWCPGIYFCNTDCFDDVTAFIKFVKPPKGGGAGLPESVIRLRHHRPFSQPKSPSLEHGVSIHKS